MLRSMLTARLSEPLGLVIEYFARNNHISPPESIGKTRCDPKQDDDAWSI